MFVRFRSASAFRTLSPLVLLAFGFAELAVAPLAMAEPPCIEDDRLSALIGQVPQLPPYTAEELDQMSTGDQVAALAADAATGATELALVSAQGISVGDRLVLDAHTNNGQGYRVAAVDATANTVTLDEPTVEDLTSGTGLFQFQKRFMDSRTFVGRSSWGRNSIEQEAVYRLQCVNEPNVVLDRAEIFRIVGGDTWDRFDAFREPQAMLAFHFNTNADEAPWDDVSHATREQVKYVWFGVSTSRGALNYDRQRMTINGVRIRDDESWGARRDGIIEGVSEVRGTMDYFDDLYGDTAQFDLVSRFDPFTGQYAPASGRVRSRYESPDGNLADGTRILEQTKIAIPPAPGEVNAVKTVAKADSRRDGVREQETLDALWPGAARGIQGWGTGLAPGFRALYQQIAKDGSTFSVGPYKDVLVLQPKLRVHSGRTRYHMDDVPTRNIIGIHEDANERITELRAAITPAIRADIDQMIADAPDRIIELDQEIAVTTDPDDLAELTQRRDTLQSAIDTGAFPRAIEALTSETWLVDAVAAETGLTPQQVTTDLTDLADDGWNTSRPTSIEHVDRLSTVAHTASDVLHGVGRALGADERELIKLIVPEVDDEDGAELFEAWAENAGEGNYDEVGTFPATDAEGQTRIYTSRQGARLGGIFSGVQIRVREPRNTPRDNPGDPGDPDQWGDWEDIDVVGGQVGELAADAAAGDRTLTLVDVTGLTRDTTLLIGTGADQRAYRIWNIDAQANTVRINQGLAADAPAATVLNELDPFEVLPVWDDDRLETRFQLRAEPGATPTGEIALEASLPSGEATRARQLREVRPLFERWREISAMDPQPKADALLALAGREVDDQEFERIGEQLRWQDSRRFFKRVDAGGTAMTALWFRKAMSFYLNVDSQWGNVLIDTMDIAGLYPHRDGDASFDAGDNTLGPELMSMELVNEVQIELGNALAAGTFDRAREYENSMLEEKTHAFMTWAAANSDALRQRFPNLGLPADPADWSVNSDPTNTDLPASQWERLWETLQNQLLADVTQTVDAVNATARDLGYSWAQAPGSTGAPVYPLTISEFRGMRYKIFYDWETPPGGQRTRVQKAEGIFTAPNRDRTVRTGVEDERMREGVEFIWGRYRESQNQLAEAKRAFVIDTLQDALDDAAAAGNPNVPECSEWQWVPSLQSKGERGMRIVMERAGFDPPTAPPPVTTVPETVAADVEPNGSVGAVRHARPGNGVPSNSFLPLGDPVAGTLFRPGSTAIDRDVYRVELPASGTLNITLQPPAGTDFNVELLSSGGQVLATGSGGAGMAETITYTPPGTAAIFYVRVSGEQNAQSEEVYTLTSS